MGAAPPLASVRQHVARVALRRTNVLICRKPELPSRRVAEQGGRRAMTAGTIAHPHIASQAEWLAARKELLAREKEVTRARDALSAARRRLPMVRLDRDYRFTGPDGEAKFSGLFEGRRQLIIYHFMFDPRW